MSSMTSDTTTTPELCITKPKRRDCLQTLTLATLKYFCINHWDKKFLFLIWNHYKSSFSFFRSIWIPMVWVYGHYKYFTLSVRGPTLDVRIWRLKSDVYRRQILMSKVGPRAERGNTSQVLPFGFVMHSFVPGIWNVCSTSQKSNVEQTSHNVRNSMSVGCFLV